MNQEIVNNIAAELDVMTKHVKVVLNLLSEGSTVPFIARYRKEMTGSLDENQIRVIEKEYNYQESVTKRKEEVIRLIEEKGMLTEDLKLQIQSAVKLSTIEDLYLPFKEKRKTKATEAVKHGLQPLADYMMTFPVEGNIEEVAGAYINDDVLTTKAAITGACNIISEIISETAKFREYTRNFTRNNGIIETKLKKDGKEQDEKGKYEIYYDFSLPVKKMKSYQTLAIARAEKEKVITSKITIKRDPICVYIKRNFLTNPDTYLVELFVSSIEDALKRLIYPSIEREVRKGLIEEADIKAIELFSQNLDVLILQPPLKDKVVLGVDPAFRTGCKLALIDQTGNLKKIDVIYPTAPKNDTKGATVKLNKILADYEVNQIVIGNGTASRETENFINAYCKSENKNIPISIVSEAGASVYSGSKIAQEEFPDLKIEERSAVSIARRIQEPMAELVKIDPKSIGVGQYQHDVNQKELAENLDFVMIKNINRIGVNVNTASKELLKYVSGLDKTIAKNIVQYRNQHGKFTDRNQLLEVTRLGSKAYEQAAGFLKIMDGTQTLDMTFIHPESYEVARKIIDKYTIDMAQLGTMELADDLIEIDIYELAKELEVSDILVNDIIEAFIAPNIDLRDEVEVASFDKSVTSIDDIKEGMELQGQVRNIVDFGAFVDIGIKNDGLVHISQLSNSFVNNVNDIVSIGDIKTFKVISVDEQKGRVQLSLKK